VTVSETTIKNSENLGRQLPNSDGQSDKYKRADELRAGSSSVGCKIILVDLALESSVDDVGAE
jgi:hypothetical protein